MNKLPKLYKCQNNLENHNKKCCYIPNRNIIKESNIDEKIKYILSNSNYLSNISVIIKTKDKEYKTSIVSKVNNRILTLDNNIIPVSEILDIEIV